MEAQLGFNKNTGSLLKQRFHEQQNWGKFKLREHSYV